MRMRQQRNGGCSSLQHKHQPHRGQVRFGPLGCDGISDRFRYIHVLVQLSWNSAIDQCIEDSHATGWGIEAVLTGEYRMTQETSASGGCLVSRFASYKQVLTGEDGTDLVEFAIVFLLLMTLLFGIAGFGHALYAYHFVSNEAREATRWAAVNGSTCATDSSCTAPATRADIQSFVTNHTPLGIDSTQVTANATWNPPGSFGPSTCSTTNNAPGCTVEVQVSYNFRFVFPLIRTTVLPLSSTSEMVISH
jgi:Flp pilus assembly protein TadG